MSITAIMTLSASLTACGGGGSGPVESTQLVAVSTATDASVSAPSLPAALQADMSEAQEQDSYPVFFSGATDNQPTIANDAPASLEIVNLATVVAPTTSEVNAAETVQIESDTASQLSQSPGLLQPIALSNNDLLAANNIVTTQSASQAGATASQLELLFGPVKTIGLNAPKLNDVVFSPRFERAESLAAAKAYGATRTEWSYINKPVTLSEFKSPGVTSVGGAINNNTPTPSNSGAAIDFDGKPIVAPWMKSWGAVWNSCANDSAQQALKKAAAALIAAGATSIQFDDAGMQLDSEYFGAGDFSAANLRGFSAWVLQQEARGNKATLTSEQAANYGTWLRTQYSIKSSAEYLSRRNSVPSTVDFRQYMKTTVIGCIEDLKSVLKTPAGKQVSLSLSVHTPYPWGANAYLAPLADFVVGEVDAAHDAFANVYFFAEWLRSIGRRWVPVFPIADKAAQRQKISAAYAVGAVPMVPWDVWIPPGSGSSNPPPRFFGQPSDFADLFLFAKKMGALLDGSQPLSRLNVVVYQDHVGTADAATQLKRLSDLHVPYAVSLRKDDWTLASNRNKASLHRTLRLSKNPRFTNDTFALLKEATDNSLTELSLTSSQLPGIDIVAAAKASNPNKRVVHLLRTDAAAEVKKPVTLKLKSWVLPAGSQATILVHRPGKDSLTLKPVPLSEEGTLSIDSPAFDEWCILEIDVV